MHAVSKKRCRRIPKSQLPRQYHGPMPTKKLETAPLSNQQLMNLSVQKQVIVQLKQAQIITFPQLVKCLDFIHHEEKLLDILEEVAVLVRGNWLLKSSLVYEQTFKSSHGVDRIHMIHAYYQMLMKFQHKVEVTHAEMQVLTQLPASDVTDILKIFARSVKQTKDKEGHWVFKLPTDEQFINTYKYRENIFMLLETKLKSCERKSYNALMHGSNRTQEFKNKNNDLRRIPESSNNTSMKKEPKKINRTNKELFKNSMKGNPTERQLSIKYANAKRKQQNINRISDKSVAKQDTKKSTAIAKNQIQPVLQGREEPIRISHNNKKQQVDSIKYKMQHTIFDNTRKTASKKDTSSKNHSQAVFQVSNENYQKINTVKNFNQTIYAKKEENSKAILKHKQPIATESKISSNQQVDLHKDTTKTQSDDCKHSQVNKNKEARKKKDSKLKQQVFIETQIKKLFECDNVIHRIHEKQPYNLKTEDNCGMPINKPKKETEINIKINSLKTNEQPSNKKV